MIKRFLKFIWEMIKPPPRARMSTEIVMKDTPLSNLFQFTCHHKFLVVDNQTPYATKILIGDKNCQYGLTTVCVNSNEKGNFPLPDSEMTCLIESPGWVDIKVIS